MKLKETILFLLTIILVNGSCKNIFRKDLSLTVKEYYLLGMPNIDSVWNEDSYVKAHITVSNIRIKNFSHLPRKDSKKSGAVFNHIISKDYLSFLNDSSKSLRDKAFQIQSLSSFLNELSRMYTDNLQQRQYYSEELTEIFIYEIYVKGKMLELAEKIMNSKDKDAISMQSGRKAIVAGYINLMTTLIKNQEKTKSFSVRELKKLDKEVAFSFANNLKYLDSESKQKIRLEIKSIIEKTHSAYIRKDFAEVLKSFKD